MTSDRLTPDQYIRAEEWLDVNGYGSTGEWARDSGYVRDEYEAGHPEPSVVGWIDEHGNPVDVDVALWHAIEAAETHA